MRKCKLYATMRSYEGYSAVVAQIKRAKAMGLEHFEEVPHDIHGSCSNWAIFSNYEVTREEMLADFNADKDLPKLNY